MDKPATDTSHHAKLTVNNLFRSNRTFKVYANLYFMHTCEQTHTDSSIYEIHLFSVGIRSGCSVKRRAIRRPLKEADVLLRFIYTIDFSAEFSEKPKSNVPAICNFVIFLLHQLHIK